jgi:DNA-nicking Smr family endonuclease
MTLTKELDLHNVRHKDVQSVMDKFLGEHMMKGTNEIRIVTGNSDNMKKVVDDVLNDYGLTSQPSPLNNGILIIKL